MQSYYESIVILWCPKLSIFLANEERKEGKGEKERKHLVLLFSWGWMG